MVVQDRSGGSAWLIELGNNLGITGLCGWLAKEEVVLTALAKEAHRRFASVHAFATALEQASVTHLRPAPLHKNEAASLPMPELPPGRLLPTIQPPVPKSQPPVMIPTTVIFAGASHPPKEAIAPQPEAPEQEIDTSGDQRHLKQQQAPSTPLPPVMEYTPAWQAPDRGSAPLPVAMPGTYTSRNMAETKYTTSLQRKNSKHLFLMIAIFVIMLLLIIGIVFILSGRIY